MKNGLRILIAILALALAGVHAACAQVVGLQPEGLGVYNWNSTQQNWYATVTGNTASPLATPPRPVALYALNPTLAQWVPWNGLPLSGPGSPSIACTAGNYGQTWFDTTGGVTWTCTPGGWVNRTPVAASGPPTTTCTSANYGQTWFDYTTSILYTCGATGWVEYNVIGPFLPLTGGTISGSLSLSGTGTFGVPGALNAQIAAIPSGGTLVLPPGVYTLSALTITNPITVQGMGRDLTQVQIQGSPNVGITVAASNVTFEDLDISGAVGQTFSVVGQTGFRLLDSRLHGTATLAYSAHCSAVVYLQGGSGHWIVGNEFTANGLTPVSGASYEVCANYDIDSSNYFTSNVHVDRNWFHDSHTSFDITCFNCDSSTAGGNAINQGNNWDGVTQGYALNFYNNNEGICGTLVRVGNTVTCTWTGGMTPAMQYPVGAPIFVHLGTLGSGGTDFTGAFNVVTSTGTAITWTQAAPDDTATPDTYTVNFGFGGDHADGNTIENVAGNAIYLQSIVGSTANSNVIIDPALQMPDSSICQAGISLAGWEQVATGNVIRGSGKSGICVGGYRAAVSGNDISQSQHFDIYLRGAQHGSFKGDTLSNGLPAAIGGDSSTSTIDGYALNFESENITAAAGGAGYSFTGPDKGLKVLGGWIKAGPSGSPSYGIIINNAGASGNDIDSVTISCNADESSVATFEDGIYYGGSNSHISGNTITGCNRDGNAFGILEAATGLDNWYQSNDVLSSHTGLEVTGTNPHVVTNSLWDNSLPLSCSAATAANCVMNLLTETGSFAPGFSDVTGTASMTQLPPIPFGYDSGNLATIPSTGVGAVLVAGNGQKYTQISVRTNLYSCSGTPQAQIEFYDFTSAAVLSSISVPTTAGMQNGTTISVTPILGHQLGWMFNAGGVSCTGSGLNISALVQ